MESQGWRRRVLTWRELPATVLERAPKLTSVAAGIVMNPNPIAVLERNGLAASVRLESCSYVVRETHSRRENTLGRLAPARPD